MAPIRVALIGLSARNTNSWAGVAHLPYLLSPRGRALFDIVALVNSTEEAARAAVAHYELPATTRTYGEAAALAADIAGAAEPFVDLVVVSTRVDVHHAVLEVLEAAKRTGRPVGALVEWPLADSPAHIRELAALDAGVAAATGATGDVGPTGATGVSATTAVALQGRLLPVYLAVRKLLRSGRIGRVLSSDVQAFGGTSRHDALPAHFADRRIGGNFYTIGFGHLIDSVQFVLGELVDVSARFQLQRPSVPVVVDGGVAQTVPSNVPDLVDISGRLVNSSPEQGELSPGASVHVRFRRGPPFSGQPGLVWTVAGETGEVCIMAPSGPTVQAAGAFDTGPDAMTITVEDYSGGVELLPWSWAAAVAPDTETADAAEETGPDAAGERPAAENWITELPMPSRAVGLLYEAIAAGDSSRYATFAEAARRHEQLEAWLVTWDGK